MTLRISTTGDRFEEVMDPLWEQAGRLRFRHQQAARGRPPMITGDAACRGGEPGGPAPGPVVALADISKAFGPTLANAEIDLTVGAGRSSGWSAATAPANRR